MPKVPPTPGTPISRYRDGKKAGDAVGMLIEGDSWFAFPMWLRTNIIAELKNINQDKIVQLDLSTSGDEARQMLCGDEFAELYRILAQENLEFDCILFSGGGNDIVSTNLPVLLNTYVAGNTWEDCLNMPRFRRRLHEIENAYLDLADLRDADHRDHHRVHDVPRRHRVHALEPTDPSGSPQMSAEMAATPGAPGTGMSSDLRQRAEAELRAQRRERWSLLLHKPAFLVGVAITGIWLFCALFGTLIAPQDPSQQDLIHKLQGPSAKHWFGLDEAGRDVFSRVIVGARVIVLVALGATILATIAGTIIGLCAGYFKGMVDEILMRIADVFISIPTVVLALLITAALNSRSSWLVTFIIAVVFTPIISRTVRATVLGEAELDYVASARLRTEKTPHILFSELLPNILPPLLVEFTVRLGYAIFAIATLSFLGAGFPPGSPDWGTQVATHWKYLTGLNWAATVFPSIAIASLAIGVNLMQDGLQEVFDR